MLILSHRSLPRPLRQSEFSLVQPVYVYQVSYFVAADPLSGQGRESSGTDTAVDNMEDDAPPRKRKQIVIEDDSDDQEPNPSANNDVDMRGASEPEILDEMNKKSGSRFKRPSGKGPRPGRLATEVRLCFTEPSLSLFLTFRHRTFLMPSSMAKTRQRERRVLRR